MSLICLATVDCGWRVWSGCRLLFAHGRGMTLFSWALAQSCGLAMRFMPSEVSTITSSGLSAWRAQPWTACIGTIFCRKLAARAGRMQCNLLEKSLAECSRLYLLIWPLLWPASFCFTAARCLSFCRHAPSSGLCIYPERQSVISGVLCSILLAQFQTAQSDIALLILGWSPPDQHTSRSRVCCQVGRKILSWLGMS